MKTLADEFDGLDTGQRIRHYRIAQGLTQEALAKSASLRQSDIYILENGKRPGVTVKKLQAIAKALGVTTSHLLGEVPFLAEWPLEVGDN